MEQDAKAEEQLRTLAGAQLLCSFPQGAMPLIDPRAFSRRPVRYRGLRSRQTFRIYLMENQPARDRAPVDMSRLVGEVNKWCGRNQVQCEIKAQAEAELSASMSILSHWWLYARAVSYHRRGQLNWFDGRHSTELMVASPARHANVDTQRLLEGVEEYDKYVGALGFIPAALRTLLDRDGKDMTKERRRATQVRIAMLSQTVFLGTFRLWMDRRRREVAWSRIPEARAMEAQATADTEVMCLRSGPIGSGRGRGSGRGKRGRGRGRGRRGRRGRGRRGAA